MKHLCTLTILSLLLSGCDVLNIENDLDDFNLEGKVESVRLRSFRVVEEDGQFLKGEQLGNGSSHINTMELFNKKGFIAQRSIFDNSENITQTTLYDYDSNHNIVEESLSYTDGSYQRIINYLYENDVLQETYSIKGLDTLSTTTFHYDETGALTEIIHYTSSGEVGYVSTVSTTNDDDIETTEKSSVFTDYSYEIYEKVEKHSDRIVYREYNIMTNTVTNQSITTYKYDNLGNLTEEVHTEKKNDIIESSMAFTFTYDEFDKKNNWTKRIRFTNDNAGIVQEREIEYF